MGRTGVWTGQFAALGAADVRRSLSALEELGYRSIWYGEAFGREAMALGSLILESTEQMIAASGIANIYGRDPTAMVNGALSLAEASEGRFVLGIGVSHGPLVTRRGQRYDHPYSHMVDYLDAMETVRTRGPEPPGGLSVVLAALGPKMLELSAKRTTGAHPYFTPVSHTARARNLMGPDAFLAPELMVVLDADADRARATARQNMAPYLRMPNYRRMILGEGFTEDDVASVPDELVDAIVAWGDVAACVARVRAHLDAGADHVPVQVLTDDATTFPIDEFAELAPALAELES